jgi:CRP-like cAMP-binding protein
MDHSLILKNIGKHIQLTQAEEDFFTSKLQYKVFKKRAYVLASGKTCRATTFVLSGCLRSYYETENKRHILQFAITDWWIGDLKSFVKETPSEIMIDALADTEVFQIYKRDLALIYERIPKFERFFRILMEHSLIAHQDRILNNHLLTAKSRYAKFVEKYPAFYQNIPLKDIANYLGITPEHLSTIRNPKKIF